MKFETNAETLNKSSIYVAQSALEHVLQHNPETAKALAEQALEHLPLPKRTGMMNGSMTRIAMLRTIVKRADKLLAESK